MGLLFPNYSKPGPGVNPDEPRKKGFARLWEVFARDHWFIMMTGFLALVSMIPFIVGLLFAYNTHSLFVMLLFGLVGGLIAAPGLCGLADLLLRCLRDEPGYCWQRYGEVIKKNWKGSILPGALFGIVFSVQCFTLLHLPQSESGLGMLLCQIFSMLVSMSLFLYVLMQTVLMELPLSKMLKNSLYLFQRYLPKTLAVSLVQLVYWMLIVLFFPITATILIFTSIWLPLLIAFVLLYPEVDGIFQIEERLEKFYEI